MACNRSQKPTIHDARFDGWECYLRGWRYTNRYKAPHHRAAFDKGFKEAASADDKPFGVLPWQAQKQTVITHRGQ